MRKAKNLFFSLAFVLYDMEMMLSASHRNARGQGHFRTVSCCTSVMVMYINFVFNNFSAISLVQVSGEGLQDQWSSGLIMLYIVHAEKRIFFIRTCIIIYNKNIWVGWVGKEGKETIKGRETIRTISNTKCKEQAAITVCLTRRSW